jgi:hypothetical protein
VSAPSAKPSSSLDFNPNTHRLGRFLAPRLSVLRPGRQGSEVPEGDRWWNGNTDIPFANWALAGTGKSVSNPDPKDDHPTEVDQGLFAANPVLSRREASHASSHLRLYVGIPAAVIVVVALVLWVVSITHRSPHLLTTVTPAPAPAMAPEPPPPAAQPASPARLAEVAPSKATARATAVAPRRERRERHRSAQSASAQSASAQSAPSAESSGQAASALEQMSSPPPTLNLPSAQPPPVVAAPPAAGR